MPRQYDCKGCQGRTSSPQRLCPRCCYEVVHGLYGGRWVVVKGVRRWVPDAPSTDAVLRAAHTRYRWHGARDDETVRLNREYKRRHTQDERARRRAA